VSASHFQPKRQQREPRNQLDPTRPYAMLVDKEPNRLGEVESIGTVFLTNRECPYQCTMCDLWNNTLRDSVRPGQIPLQIEYAIEQLPKFDSIKLYNSGNFFDQRAIPPEDYSRIAELVGGYKQVIVENHARLCYEPCREFAERVSPAQFEVAIGLETCHVPSLTWMNKSMTLEDFDWAIERLLRWSIKTRVFILLGLPHMSVSESLGWAMKSIEYAAKRGVDCFSVVPTRPTLEPMQQLIKTGGFQVSTPEIIEAVLDQAIPLNLGRVFVDLWDADRFFNCDHCRTARVARLAEMNLRQEVLPKINCEHCGCTSS
jgi:archaeosine synthase beta-subunit